MFSNPIPYVWLLVGLVAATPILVSGARQWFRRRQSTDWKPVLASIQKVEQVDPHRSHGKYLRLSYSYYVEEFRSGEYHFFLPNNVPGEEIARLLRDASVEALYDPRNPDRSILSEVNLFETAARARKLEIPHELPPPAALIFDVADYNKPSSTDTPS